MHSNDIKIALCEDYCLTGIFSRAVKLIETRRPLGVNSGEFGLRIKMT